MPGPSATPGEAIRPRVLPGQPGQALFASVTEPMEQPCTQRSAGSHDHPYARPASSPLADAGVFP
jgi:hypothetical protein